MTTEAKKITLWIALALVLIIGVQFIKESSLFETTGSAMIAAAPPEPAASAPKPVASAPTTSAPKPVASAPTTSNIKEEIHYLENKNGPILLDELASDNDWKPSDIISLLGTIFQFIIGAGTLLITYKTANSKSKSK